MEKQGYRENLELLLALFPGRASISVDEAARVMNVHADTVYHSIHRVRNPLPVQRMGGHKIIISIPSLARWMCG